MVQLVRDLLAGKWPSVTASDWASRPPEQDAAGDLDAELASIERGWSPGMPTTDETRVQRFDAASPPEEMATEDGPAPGQDTEDPRRRQDAAKQRHDQADQELRQARQVLAQAEQAEAQRRAEHEQAASEAAAAEQAAEAAASEVERAEQVAKSSTDPAAQQAAAAAIEAARAAYEQAQAEAERARQAEPPVARYDVANRIPASLFEGGSHTGAAFFVWAGSERGARRRELRMPAAMIRDRETPRARTLDAARCVARHFGVPDQVAAIERAESGQFEPLAVALLAEAIAALLLELPAPAANQRRRG